MPDRPTRKPRRPHGPPPSETMGSTTRSTPPSDPRVCRLCGERVIDMKYHLGKMHPRPSRDRRPAITLDHGTQDALQQLSGLLEQARELVFKEPLRATSLIDQARQWLEWTRDLSRAQPAPRSGAAPAAGPSAGSKRHLMQAPPKQK